MSFVRKRRLMKWMSFISLLGITVLIFTKHKTSSECEYDELQKPIIRSEWKKTKVEIPKMKLKMMNVSNETVGCSISKLDPYDKSVLPFLQDMGSGTCAQQRSFVLHGTLHVVTGGELMHAEFIDMQDTTRSAQALMRWTKSEIKRGMAGCLMAVDSSAEIKMDGVSIVRPDTLADCPLTSYVRFLGEGFIRHLRTKKCIASTDGSFVSLSNTCQSRDTVFTMENHKLKHEATGKCLHVTSSQLTMTPCSDASHFAIWTISMDYSEGAKNHTFGLPILTGENRGKCGREYGADCSTDEPMYGSTEISPCCSPSGWCGITRDHCSCSACVDFRRKGHLLIRKGMISMSLNKIVTVKVTLWIGDDLKEENEFHINVYHRPITAPQPPSDRSLNIIMLMFDSTSHSNAIRNWKKSYARLKNDPDTHILNSHTIVGEATTPNILAILTGRLQSELPEARRGNPGARPLDNYPFIFKELREAGYVTAFDEDNTDTGAFSHRLLGFEKAPTDWYLRHFWKDGGPKIVAKGVSCVAKKILDYQRDLLTSYPNTKKFSLLINSHVCHDNINLLSHSDNLLDQFLSEFNNSVHRNRSALIVFGDHGSRTKIARSNVGKLEERLPFFAIALPTWFKRTYPTFHRNLQRNTDRLTTQYDVYPTLMHLMDLKAVPITKPVLLGSSRSLFTDIDSKRTCNDAGITERWCPCLEFKVVDETDPLVKSIADKIVRKINDKLCRLTETCEKCAEVGLMEIKDAKRRMPTKAERAKSLESYYYELVITVSPSGGLFEADCQVEYGTEGDIKSMNVDDDISRIDRYGSQPECIAQTQPEMRPYCMCKPT